MEPNPRIAALVRWRIGLATAAIVIPLALFFLFERQARRLDALADHGVAGEAYVTGVSADGTTFYAYEVGPTEYTWNVKRSDAPYPPGHVFPITYLPEDPTLNRPITDRTLAARDAASSRGFGWKVALGVAIVLALFAFLAHRDLARLRAGTPSELVDPRAYTRRLKMIALLLAVPLVGITAFHANDAMKRGEAIAPVVISVVVIVAILGGIFYVASREGPAGMRERTAKVMRWAAPIALGIAALRLIALIFGK